MEGLSLKAYMVHLMIILILFQQYGGFYKHQIENCLSGAEKLFHQMGYVSTGQETLELNGAVDQDKATIVARDCILAYVECQVSYKFNLIPSQHC